MSLKTQEVPYRDYRILQVTPDKIAKQLGCDEFEAANRCAVGGMTLPVVYVVRDEFDGDPMILPGMWFESPLTARAAIDIHCYGEGFQRDFWPNYHDVYIAMRHCPAILKTFQELHRQTVEICNDGLTDQSDFAFIARERLARLFVQMEFNLKGADNGAA